MEVFVHHEPELRSRLRSANGAGHLIVTDRSVTQGQANVSLLVAWILTLLES